ncbi:MAG TPA: DNA gyrase inhibitor YacG [Burkholderiales bacterium]|nr:DNA gyrase inhibitor YacG [Burkholderiales bacterium]
MSEDTVVPCPRCGSATTFSAANRWRPFCSERCKIVDLGNWASERYRVPDPTPPDLDGAPAPDAPPGG